MTLSLLLLVLCCLVSAVKSENNLSIAIEQEQGESSSPTPIVYPMKLVYIFEEGKPEVILVVGNAGFKSVASLKNWVDGLTPGTTIEFDMTCKRIGNEPLVSSEEEMNDFRNFCKQHDVNLVIRPAG